MTTPKVPVDAPLAGDPGWDDPRLAAAFAARAARVVVPAGLVAVTVERLRPPARRSPWARMLPAGAALVLVLGLVGGGIAFLGGSGGLVGSGAVTFRDGPTSALRTLDGGEYALDFPAAWLAYPASAIAGSGGSIDAVLTTQPIEERCDGLLGADINCVYDQRLEPGQLRVFVGSNSYRAQTVLDRADIENGTTTRLVVGGMPAILDEFDDAPDDHYLADQSATWAIATPTSLARVIRIEFMAREPAVDAARTAVEALVASFRFTPPPTPLPGDPAAAVTTARAVLDAEAAAFRQGFVPADDSDGQTYLDCLPEAPGEDRVVGIDYGPGGDLGWTVLTRCRWTVVADENGPFWRIETVYEWTAGDDFGRYREAIWIDAAGLIVARSNSGEVPPAGDPSATLEPTPTPEPTVPAWGPWPPDGAEVIELANDDPARVAIVDLSGELVEVRAATAQDGQLDGPDEGFLRDPSGDGRYRLRWGTTICDREMTVTIEAELDLIVIDHAPRDGCDLMGIRRELVLEFSRDIDPASVELVVNRAVLLPEPPPEPTVMTVDLIRGDTTDRIVVTDQAGSLMEARPADLADVPAAIQSAPGTRLARVEDGGTVVLWDGGWCDSDITITIEADDLGPPDRIIVRSTPAQGPCRLGLVHRAVWLDLGPVNVNAIIARHDVAAAPTVPRELFGLEVIDVDDALAIQRLPNDDREIAVSGWLQASMRRGCGVWSTNSVIEPRCPGAWLGTTQGAEGRFVVATHLPLWDMLRDAGAGTTLSTDLVAIGHFDDRRSSECETAMEAACRDVFWIDTVWVDGARISRDWIVPPPDDATSTPPLGTADDAAAVAMSFLDDDPTRTMPHDGEVLSVGLLPGDQLATLEPTMRSICGRSCDALFQAPAWVWHVTMLDRTLAEVRTFVINDDQFDGRRSISVREPTIAGVVERETMVISAEGPGIVLGLNAEGLPVPIEANELPLQVP